MCEGADKRMLRIIIQKKIRISFGVSVTHAQTASFRSLVRTDGASRWNWKQTPAKVSFLPQGGGGWIRNRFQESGRRRDFK